MTDPATSPTPATSKVTHKPKGRPDMPPRQYYHGARRCPRLRLLTRMWSSVWGTRPTPERKSALAFFTLRYETGERPD